LSRYFDQIAGDELEKACSDIVRLLTGFSQSEVREIAARTVQYETASPVSTRTLGRYRLPRGIRFIHDSLQLLDFLRARGFDIWIVSGSNRWSVEAVFSRLDVPFGHVIGIELAESHGTLKPEVKTPVPVRQGKVRALREHIAAPPLIVISDSVNDIPLLRYSAGMKVVMNSKGDNVSEFSFDGELTQDESWLVIESPTIEAADTQVWPTRQ
jgi:HAD superfamily phosphoserine phosphatase-like hydrolase